MMHIVYQLSSLYINYWTPPWFKQEKEEEANALKRQAQSLAAKKPATPADAAEEEAGAAATVSDALPDKDLLQQTDDAKV